jgi:hypothetical protein
LAAPRRPGFWSIDIRAVLFVELAASRFEDGVSATLCAVEDREVLPFQ